jgi:hypothetical protein
VNAGAVPLLLVCAALALALVAAPWRAACVVTFLVASVAVASMPVVALGRNALFLGCWLSVIASVASIRLPRPTVGLAVSFLAGICAGGVAAAAGPRFDLMGGFVLLAVLLRLGLFVRRRLPVALDVAASWLIAVALIAAALQILLETPGYLPDHTE